MVECELLPAQLTPPTRPSQTVNQPYVSPSRSFLPPPPTIHPL
jgi:hypothetical protein